MNGKMKDCVMTVTVCEWEDEGLCDDGARHIYHADPRLLCCDCDLCIVYSPVILVVPPWRLHCVHNGDSCGIIVTCMYSVQTDDSYDFTVTHALCTDR